MTAEARSALAGSPAAVAHPRQYWRSGARQPQFPRTYANGR
jgi:hypothetical protein